MLLGTGAPAHSRFLRVKVRVRVSVSCAFSVAFVRIAAVGIAACTP